MVIAIIGVLSSIVMASLNNARNRGSDAAIKADMSGLRTAAELYYGSVLSYGTQAFIQNCSVSPTAGTVFNDADVQKYLDDAVAKSGQTAATAARCNAGGTYYVVAVQLKSSSSSGWCVDNSGNSKLITWSGYTSARTSCP